jgi:8-oxo-dGTP diphosphatase
MRDRAVSSAPARSPSRRSPFTVDVILFTPRGKQLAVLSTRAADARAKERWVLPYDAVDAEESLDAAARRIAKLACGADVTWIEQVGAFADGRRHPSDEPLSIAFVAVIPANVASTARGEAAWFGVTEPPTLAPRQRAMLDSALELMRTRMDYAPIAFRLLPPMFTLSELQQMYELLLGKRLHKASFRRALQAAYLVEPTDEWRSEGRGRPAQLFRYAPRRRRNQRRGVRFDLLGG